MKNRFNIAVIAGDGIGKEVMPEGIKVLKKVSEKFDINLNFEEFDFSSYDYYKKHGQMMPNDWKEKISNHDAIFFGAVGWPDKIPDHVSLWGSLLKFRRELWKQIFSDEDFIKFASKFRPLVLNQENKIMIQAPWVEIY